MTDRTSPETETFLPCPFCGQQPFVDNDRDGVCSVSCHTGDCLNVEVVCPTADDALAFWNRRPGLAPTPDYVRADDLAYFLCHEVAGEPYDEVSANKYTGDALAILRKFEVAHKADAQSPDTSTLQTNREGK